MTYLYSTDIYCHISRCHKVAFGFLALILCRVKTVQGQVRAVRSTLTHEAQEVRKHTALIRLKCFNPIDITYVMGRCYSPWIRKNESRCWFNGCSGVSIRDRHFPKKLVQHDQLW